MAENGEDRKLEELEQLLNDPDVPLEPSRVWQLLAELAGEPTASPR
jgi:hypothetical protein